MDERRASFAFMVKGDKIIFLNLSERQGSIIIIKFFGPRNQRFQILGIL